MKRRTFVQQASLLAFSASAFGSISWNGKNYVADSPTTTDILGPFYRPNSPMRSNIIPADSKGEVMHLTGKIFEKGGIKPMANALIEIWQCDENQHYDNTSSDYKFRGAMRTNSDGKYHFKTIVPVAYKASPTSWRPAHIHLRISSSDHQDLISQIYFKGDPHLKDDVSSTAPEANNRILEIKKNDGGEKNVVFNIVMRESYAVDPGVFDKITGLYQLDKGIVEFVQEGDLLFVKWNGQLVEGLEYKGDNTFEGGIGYIKAKFTLQEEGGAKVRITMNDYDINDPAKHTTFEGAKFLKYNN